MQIMTDFCKCGIHVTLSFHVTQDILNLCIDFSLLQFKSVHRNKKLAFNCLCIKVLVPTKSER